jgi:hypothetical protein
MDNQDLDEDVEIKEPGWMRALRYTCPTCGAKRTKVSSDPSTIAISEISFGAC